MENEGLDVIVIGTGLSFSISAFWTKKTSNEILCDQKNLHQKSSEAKIYLAAETESGKKHLRRGMLCRLPWLLPRRHRTGGCYGLASVPVFPTGAQGGRKHGQATKRGAEPSGRLFYEGFPPLHLYGG